MSDTRQLLTRISALRERLAQVGAVAPPEADTQAIAAHILSDPTTVAPALKLLAPPTVTIEAGPAGPALTLRARKLLEQARELVAVERELGTDPLLQTLLLAGTDPLAAHYRDTVSLTEAGLRVAQSLPDRAELQLRACDGLETLFSTARDRISTLARALAARRLTQKRIEGLARRLTDLTAGRVVDLGWFVELAQDLLGEAGNAEPIAFLNAPVEPGTVARFVACHSLTVAQVIARVGPHDYEWTAHPVTPILAALLMDVGMVSLPAELVGKTGPLSADERRLLASHPRRGAELIASLYPESDVVCAAIAAHHERPDGTGYPVGRAGDDIPSLARLLAVCDQYAGRVGDRPHRVGIDPRTALTETLLAAEAGRVDKDFAELLLHVGMFPVGAVVELTDGRIGVVVANHAPRVNLRAAARPVVAVLTDAAGQVLPRPDHIDLAAADRGGVVRALPVQERPDELARNFPELCG